MKNPQSNTHADKQISTMIMTETMNAGMYEL